MNMNDLAYCEMTLSGSTADGQPPAMSYSAPTAQMMRAMAEIFASSVATPQAPPSAARIRDAFSHFFAAHPELTALASHQAMPPPRQSCAEAAVFLRAVLATAPADRSILLRGIFGTDVTMV
jgi:hypothetical protein